MIKVSLDKNDGSGYVIGLGLSRRNTELLLEGKPIRVNAAEMIPKDGKLAEILLFAGEDEQTMAKWFEEFIGPDTRVHVDPRLK